MKRDDATAQEGEAMPRRGFTRIELLVVVVILGILIALMAPPARGGA